jgi:hypothetical protein
MIRHNDTSGGHLVLVTCNTFPIGKWGEISEATNKDHDQLQYLLTHELIGKFEPDNVHVLKNPSTNEFKDTLSHLKKQVDSSGFVVIYLATHVVKVVKGEKENSKELSYLAFHNSVWGKQNEIAESCISLSTFCTLLNKIPCTQKTVIFNYAHLPPPRSALFPSSKVLYPSHDFLSKLCERAKCAVIGSCAIGTRAKEYLRHSEYHVEAVTPQKIPGLGASSAASVSVGRRMLNLFTNQDKELYNRMLEELMKEWGHKPFPEVTRSPRPIKPTATWDIPEGAITITLPNQKEVSLSAKFLSFCSVFVCGITTCVTESCLLYP